ncbi:MAG: hypothetical protein JWN62_2635 [Acidimicrobiales bacterium]|nr:hypothetical protein [Acidimicrobiales bacterium]
MTNDQALTASADLAETNTVHFPNESAEYRAARQALLVEEIDLRRQMERVAAKRRALPPGGEVPEDYHFTAEDGTDVSFADLFGGHDALIVYSYMFGPQRSAPCPMCTSMMGAIDHKIRNLRRRVSIAFIARSPIDRLMAAKQAQGWIDMPLFSDGSGDFTRTYVSATDEDMPAMNVFTRRDGTIRHFWSEEIGFDMADPGQDPRSAIELDPLWLLLDMTPEGRGEDWRPQLRS